MQKRILCYAIACLLSLNVSSTYIYEANQSLIDLTNQSGTTSLNAGDDQVSAVFNLGFTFDFYGQEFTQARIATNGCLHFKTSGAYCSDYTPDPLANQYTYTMLPFWTDLIRDNDSSMLAKSFNDKTVFGWYDMREYNRASDNSFEVILWTNDTFEYRYGALDIINHDVLIGEVGSGSAEVYEYLFHDECNTGSTNSKSCADTDWNNTDKNQNLESGGSLYGTGTGNVVDCSNPLNDYSCTGYWEAYDDLQCDLDPQYGPFCQGYRQEDSVAYYEEEPDYGYQEEYDMYDTFEEPEQYGYFEEPMFDQEYDTFEEPEYIYEEEIIFEQMFPQEEYRESFEVTQDFQREEELFMPMEEPMLDEFIFQETFLVEDFAEPETFIELETVEQLEEWFEEETRMEEELAYAEEPEEEFIEEVFEEEAVEEVFEEIEEMREEMEEERIAEVEEERQEELQEEVMIGDIRPEGKSSISRDMALNVVSSTLRTAQASVSGTTSGNSTHATGGTTGASSVSSSSSSGGMSTSNSPSMSAQFTSSTAQNNQVLDMSTSFSVSNSTSSVSVEVETVETTSVAVNVTPTQTLQSQIDVSVSTDASTTETEQTVANVIAQNLQAAQDDVESKQEETGEYGSENTIIAYMGFVPDFNSYRLVELPQKELWYEPRSIYANNMLADNTQGFYEMAGQSLNTLIEMRNLQPNL